MPTRPLLSYERPLHDPLPLVEEGRAAVPAPPQQSEVAGRPERVFGGSAEPHRPPSRHESRRELMGNTAISRKPVDAAALHGHEQTAVGLGRQADHWQRRRLCEGGKRIETVAIGVVDGQAIVGAGPDAVGGITRKRMDVSYLEPRARRLGDYSRLTIPHPVEKGVAGAHEERAVALLGDGRRHNEIRERGNGRAPGEASVGILIECHDFALQACQQGAVAAVVEHASRRQR